MKKIEDLSDKSLWGIAIVLSSISLFAAMPIWLLLRKRKKEILKDKKEEEEKEKKEKEENDIQ